MFLSKRDTRAVKSIELLFLLSEEKHVEGCKVRNRRTGSIIFVFEKKNTLKVVK